MENKQFQSPVYHVIAVPYEKIIPNTYNPNKVAPPEMKLLYDSIKADGFTMPIVCYYAKSRDMYVIVDGFHRYSVMGKYPDIYEREHGMMPVSVIEKPLSERMASTIRGDSDTGTIYHGDSCGRLHHRDPADPDHRRIPDAESGYHRTLHCQNL